MDETPAIIKIMLLIGFAIFTWDFWGCLFYDKYNLASAFRSKDNKQPFILLRNKDSYYLPKYAFNKEWLDEYKDINFSIIKTERVKIVKRKGLDFDNSYYKVFFNRWYIFYVPDDLKIYSKQVAFNLIKEGNLLNDFYDKN